MGDCILQFTGYAVITNTFSDSITKHIAYVEIVVGLGLGIGPIIGSALFDVLGYVGIMYLFGALNLLVGFLVCMLIPQQLNKSADK